MLLQENPCIRPSVSHAEQFFNTPESPSSSAVVPVVRRHDLFYAWWPSSQAETADDEELACSYHSRVKLETGEAILVDTGAIGNLAGDAWIKRTQAAGESAGRGTSFQPLAKSVSIGGVGTGNSVCVESAKVPIAFEDGVTGTYSPSVVPNSELPALLGFDVMERRRVVLDCFHGCLLYTSPSPRDS